MHGHGSHPALFPLCIRSSHLMDKDVLPNTLPLLVTLSILLGITLFPVFLPMVQKAFAPYPCACSPLPSPGMHPLTLLSSSKAGQVGPSSPERPWWASMGRGFCSVPGPTSPCPYQDIVLGNRDVAGMDGQPDALLHLRGKPAGLSGPCTALLPGAPGRDRVMRDSGDGRFLQQGAEMEVRPCQQLPGHEQIQYVQD